jgi:6-phosphogluconolactonase
MARFTARLFEKALRAKKTGLFLAVLSGGKTPRPFFEILKGTKIDWSRVNFYMADERLAPAGSAGSNFGQADRLLFSKIKIPPANLHPVKISNPSQAAVTYEKEIRKLSADSGSLDLVVLGLGEDGHIASLFPGSPALDEDKKLVSFIRAPKGVKPGSRITMTLKALNSADTIILIASGPLKRPAFAQTAANNKKIPAARLNPRRNLYILFSS